MSKVSICVESGLVYEYDVADPMKGREHTAEIIKGGYRHTPKDSDDLEWIPPHRIHKVKIEGGAESTKYRDTIRST